MISSSLSLPYFSTKKMASSLNPNAPIYLPNLLPFSTPMELTNYHSSPPPLLLPNPSPLQPNFYCEYLQTPSHTSFLYVSSPPYPEVVTYYFPPHQSLYSCCYREGLLFPFPETFQPQEEEKEKRVVASDHAHNQVGEDLEGGVVKGSFFRRRKVFASKLMHKKRFTTTLGGFEFKGEDQFMGTGSKTTVMIKNLPNKFTKGKLLSILDQHCYEENQKLAGSGDESEFNFFYLPIDFRSGSNLGYAFVNFTSAAAAWRLHHSLHKYEWKLHGSRKVCEITYARIQGLSALLKHFKSSMFLCDDLEFLPVYFDPPRNGCKATKQQYVGKHTSTSSRPL